MIPNASTNTEQPPAPNGAPTQSTVHTQELLRQTMEAKNSAMALISNVQSVVGLAENAVREQMQARPYLTMGAAAGAGYVLAGGLASSLSRTLVKAGAKAATAYLTAMVLKKVKDTAEQVANENPMPAAAE